MYLLGDMSFQSLCFYQDILHSTPRICTGPLLFLIYINNIGEELLSLTRLFADDTSMGYSNSSLDTFELVINHDLNKLSIWSEKWLMLINSDKTEIFKYGNTQ